MLTYQCLAFLTWNIHYGKYVCFGKAVLSSTFCEKSRAESQYAKNNITFTSSYNPMCHHHRNLPSLKVEIWLLTQRVMEWSENYKFSPEGFTLYKHFLPLSYTSETFITAGKYFWKAVLSSTFCGIYIYIYSHTLLTNLFPLKLPISLVLIRLSVKGQVE